MHDKVSRVSRQTGSGDLIEASCFQAQLDPKLLILQAFAVMLSGATARPEDALVRLLFVGNSFTFRNGGLAAV